MSLLRDTTPFVWKRECFHFLRSSSSGSEVSSFPINHCESLHGDWSKAKVVSAVMSVTTRVTRRPCTCDIKIERTDILSDEIPNTLDFPGKRWHIFVNSVLWKGQISRKKWIEVRASGQINFTVVKLVLIFVLIFQRKKVSRLLRIGKVNTNFYWLYWLQVLNIVSPYFAKLDQPKITK